MLKITITKNINGKNLYSHVGEGLTFREAFHALPNDFVSSVYRRAEEHADMLLDEMDTTGLDFDFPLTAGSEEEIIYNKLVDENFESAFDSEIHGNSWVVKITEEAG